MHLTILSCSSAIYTTRRLVDAARVAGHRARVLNPLNCAMYIDGPESGLVHQHKPVPRTDVCIPRIGQSIQHYGLAVVDQFAHLSVPLLNGSDAIALSRNKIRCLQVLAARGVPVPATLMASEAAAVSDLVNRVGGCPVLLKLLHGGERIGVMVCETMQSMQAALDALLGLGHDLLVQQYVRETRGRDIRALVVGGRVVAAVRRRARVGRLGRTLAAGARFEPAKLPRDFAQIAERAAQLVGLEVAAVDMLDLREGPRVFEVNSSPGIKELEVATGCDAAAAIVERAAELARTKRALKKAPPAASHSAAAAGAASRKRARRERA